MNSTVGGSDEKGLSVTVLFRDELLKTYKEIFESLLIKPEFWSALGKALGWSQDELGVCANCGARKEKECICDDGSECPIMDEWLYQATKYFRDYAMKGKSEERYFENLK